MSLYSISTTHITSARLLTSFSCCPVVRLIVTQDISWCVCQISLSTCVCSFNIYLWAHKSQGQVATVSLGSEVYASTKPNRRCYVCVLGVSETFCWFSENEAGRDDKWPKPPWSSTAYTKWGWSDYRQHQKGINKLGLIASQNWQSDHMLVKIVGRSWEYSVFAIPGDLIAWNILKLTVISENDELRWSRIQENMYSQILLKIFPQNFFTHSFKKPCFQHITAKSQFHGSWYKN